MFELAISRDDLRPKNPSLVCQFRVRSQCNDTGRMACGGISSWKQRGVRLSRKCALNHA